MIKCFLNLFFDKKMFLNLFFEKYILKVFCLFLIKKKYYLLYEKVALYGFMCIACRLSYGSFWDDWHVNRYCREWNLIKTVNLLWNWQLPLLKKCFMISKKYIQDKCLALFFFSEKNFGVNGKYICNTCSSYVAQSEGRYSNLCSHITSHHHEKSANATGGQIKT